MINSKIVFAVVIAVNLSLPCSWAGVSCTPPQKPELPSGNPDAREMEKAGQDVKSYTRQMTAYRECLVRMINDSDNEASAVIEGWNSAVEKFNGRRGEQGAN